MMEQNSNQGGPALECVCITITKQLHGTHAKLLEGKEKAHRVIWTIKGYLLRIKS